MRAPVMAVALLALPATVGGCFLVGDFDFDDWQERTASGGGGSGANGTGASSSGGEATGASGGGGAGGTGAGPTGGHGGSGGDAPDGYLPDSPTELCSNGNAFVDCGNVGVYAGQDGEYRIDVPSYATAAAIVTDSISELRWRQASQVSASSAAAASACAALAPEPDCSWRVPELVELLTLVDYGATAPALDAVFTDASVHRSSSADTGGVWGIDFDTGQTAFVSEGAAARVRCVCGTSPAASYTNNDPWVRDERTGLVWQDLNQGTTIDWDFFLLDCESLSLAGRTWRLPSIKELASIFDPTDVTPPKIDDAFFVVPGRYASSTPVATDPTRMWTMNYDTGLIVAEPISGGPSLVVRCVSGPELP